MAEQPELIEGTYEAKAERFLALTKRINELNAEINNAVGELMLSRADARKELKDLEPELVTWLAGFELQEAEIVTQWAKLSAVDKDRIIREEVSRETVKRIKIDPMEGAPPEYVISLIKRRQSRERAKPAAASDESPKSEPENLSAGGRGKAARPTWTPPAPPEGAEPGDLTRRLTEGEQPAETLEEARARNAERRKAAAAERKAKLQAAADEIAEDPGNVRAFRTGYDPESPDVKAARAMRAESMRTTEPV